MHARDYLLGYIYGDGSVRPEQVRLYGAEPDLIRVLEFAQSLGVELSPNWRLASNRKTPTWVATWPQKHRHLLGDLSGQRSGILPELEDRGSFVAGIWDADGCVSVLERQGRASLQGKVHLSSSKPTLVWGVDRLLTKMGFSPSFSLGKNHRGEQYGEIRIPKRDWGRFARLVNLQPKKATLLQRLNEAGTNKPAVRL